MRHLGATAVASAITFLPATAAQAQVTSIESVKVGLQPRSTALVKGAGGASFANAAGNPVLPASAVYAIYWDPHDLYHGDWQIVIDEFLHNMGAASGSTGTVFAVDAQYTDATGQRAAYMTSFKGAYTDTDPYPAAKCADPAPLEENAAVTCLTDEQIRTELQTFIAARSLPRGMNTVYYVLTPPGVTACLGVGATSCSDYAGVAEPENPSYANSFCSYHSAINPGPGEAGGPETVLYAVAPWTAGGLGDGQLPELDQVPGYECQAGGWKPGSGEAPAEEHEEKPTQQEPNQKGRSGDGWFDTGLADLIVSQLGVEQQGIVTDPLLNAWQGSGGAEVTDECRDFFAPSAGGGSGANANTGAGSLYNQPLSGGNYFINDAFNLAGVNLPYPGVRCLNGISLVPSFTAPNVVNAGELVGFDGMESYVTLNVGTTYEGGKAKSTYATYEWSFGDGTTVTGFAPGAPSAGSLCEAPWISPCAASAFHSYAYGGTYPVTLKITDTGGNVASITKVISVVGPPPPPPPPPLTSGGGAKSGSTSTTSSTSTSTSKPPLPRPVATAIVTTGSLTEALRRGLPVRYSVNQQVAGHFEVLLPSSLAKRLHIKGRTASGLAAGTPPQTVIAYALLVTMHKAHGTLRIEIPQPANARLGHLHKVTLTLRLVVRNASRSKPKLTLLQTVVKLRR